MNILRADINDIPDLVKLVNSAYRGQASKKGWTTEADLLDGIRTDDDSLEEMLGKPGATILKFLNDNGDIAGSVYLQKQHEKLYLGMLTVSPEIQAKGIGKQLLKVSEDYALNVGCSVVTMTVISVRKELIEWYERHGYRSTGKTEPFPNDVRFGIPKQKLEFIVMEKELTH
ncbi:MAG TPA: GNAT family N-acetyltransferase [Segetibacter sp.]|jgi:ribosomal protein S18 acetylase RimI-like enzyme